MITKHLIVVGFCLVFCILINNGCFSEIIYPEPENKNIRVLEAVVDRALEAYNKGSYMLFYDNFSKATQEAQSEQYFQATYIDIHKRVLGNYNSKILIPEKSSLNSEHPYLVYEAHFKKFNGEVTITVNFKNEDGFFKITRMNFDKELKWE